MKLCAFDLEISKEIPEGTDNLQDFAPLGISCLSLALSDREEPLVWKGVPCLTKSECQSIVREFQKLSGDGYNFLTWNGCGFDFLVLAQESGMYEECASLAIEHIDMMMIVTFNKGWYLSLQKALEGARLAGKLKKVSLSNGTVLEDMHGSKAPQLWAAGEYEAVLTYLVEDVLQLLKLATVVQHKKEIRWLSNRGKQQSIVVNKLLTVSECFDIPEPDTSWMSDPPVRFKFIEWAIPYLPKNKIPYLG